LRPLFREPEMERTELWRDIGIGAGRVVEFVDVVVVPAVEAAEVPVGLVVVSVLPRAALRDCIELWRERELPAIVLPIVAALVRAVDAFEEVRRERGER